VRKWFLVAVLLWLFLMAGWAVKSRQPSVLTSVTLAGKKLQIEIAKTAAEREKGLSDRRFLCPDCGMLFLFETPGYYGFWMKRMYFDIDIIWIRGDKVVDITRQARKPEATEFEAPKTIYSPREAVDKVLEVNAGWCEKNSVKIGDKIIIN